MALWTIPIFLVCHVGGGRTGEAAKDRTGEALDLAHAGAGAPDARIQRPTVLARHGTPPGRPGADNGGALPPGRDPRPRSRRPQEPRLLLLASEGLHVRAAAPLGPALQVEDPDGAGDDARQPRSS